MSVFVLTLKTILAFTNAVPERGGNHTRAQCCRHADSVLFSAGKIKCVCMIEFWICPPLSACVWISSAPLAPSCSSVLPLTMPKPSWSQSKPAWNTTLLFQDINYKAMYLVDTPSQNILQYFQETSKFIRDVLQAGGKYFLFLSPALTHFREQWHTI